jgi:hypothetical protein
MAVVGGTQGSQVSNVGQIQRQAGIAQQLLNSTAASKVTVSAGDADLLAQLQMPPPLNWHTDVSSLQFNFKDNMPLDDTTPLQFHVEKLSDCRLFYIKSDLFGAGSMWARIASGKAQCVDGGKLGSNWQANSATIVRNEKTSSAIGLPKASWYALAAVLGALLL